MGGSVVTPRFCVKLRGEFKLRYRIGLSNDSGGCHWMKRLSDRTHVRLRAELPWVGGRGVGQCSEAISIYGTYTASLVSYSLKPWKLSQCLDGWPLRDTNTSNINLILQIDWIRWYFSWDRYNRGMMSKRVGTIEIYPCSNCQLNLSELITSPWIK